MKCLFLRCLALFSGLLIVPATAFAFVVEDIRTEGLQRIPASALYSALPIEVGDEVDTQRIRSALRALFRSGNYEDVRFLQDGNVLVIQVQERPAISVIEIEGNKSIETEDLSNGLTQSGLSVGSVFQRVTLDRVRTELERQYIAQGRYGARVEAEVVPQPRNRVAMNITIAEGNVALIKGINIIGNEVFDEASLLDIFELKESNFWSFFKSNDKYARERLVGDLEKLRSHYLDRGHIEFTILSTQVSITPDKKHVYITISIDEGERFSVSEVGINGDLPISEEEIRPLLLVKAEQTFSRQLITLSSDLVSKRLSNEGYTFASVNGVPEIDEKSKTVKVNFYINPGKRAYVRRIEFRGNETTEDEVLRREMRQMEGSWASGTLIERSKQRLERLGFFKPGVKVETIPVPGTDDQLDVVYTVEEQSSGSLGASVGYQDGTGLIFGANIKENNFLGTGNQVSFDISRSDTVENYSLSYLDPYFTLDGVSRGYRLRFRETDYSDSETSAYRTDSFAGSVIFGYPIDEHSNLRFSFGFDRTTVKAFPLSAQPVLDFVDYTDGSDRIQEEDAMAVLGTLTWRRSTLNRGVFATKGSSNSLSLELALPGSDLEYYKASYKGEVYFPMGDDGWAVRLRTDLAYGSGYGNSDVLPFYEHYFSGGFGSVRGYRARSLGPLEIQAEDNLLTPDPFGGNLLVEGSVELIFPAPFVKDKRSIRTVLFVDSGNVFDTEREELTGLEVSADNLRYSAGIGLSWLTVVGPLTFSLSKPFNEQSEDDTEVFQFALGQTL